MQPMGKRNCYIKSDGIRRGWSEYFSGAVSLPWKTFQEVAASVPSGQPLIHNVVFIELLILSMSLPSAIEVMIGLDA
jgi:hypothetical protein